MTDIVERLRVRLKQEAVGCGEPPVIGYTGDGRLLTEAADEIERLKDEVKFWHRIADERAAEIARLRNLVTP